MEERGNKTIMCSVFFLDIVGYSKKSVTGQISLKERFNSYLSAAIRDVPVTDRIILDTGDGAAINFLGDIEDALKAALNLRESLLNEDPSMEHPLRVRMGINLGPVRLIRDINGQPNIVGDGINVAQRVMGFADASQILVSRSYYDAVSRVSPKYAGMFHYQGSRTDKHVREHEVYAIGYPGDKTTLMRKAELYFQRTESPIGKVMASVVMYLNDMPGFLIARFRQAEPKRRALYVGAGVLPLLFLVVLQMNTRSREDIPAMPVPLDQQAINPIQASSASTEVVTRPDLPLATTSSVSAGADTKKDFAAQPEVSGNLESRPVAKIMVTEEKPKAKRINGMSKEKTHEANPAQTVAVVSSGGSESFLSVRCIDGAEVFLDGTRKGRISGSSLTIQTSPGSHSVIVSHPQGVDSRNIVFEGGKTVRLNPAFCN